MENAATLKHDGQPADLLDFGEDVSVTAFGRVPRHCSRGADVTSARELRAKEDARCTAGLRRPHLLEQDWPELFAAMRPVGELLAKMVDGDPEFWSLQEIRMDTCGSICRFLGSPQTASVGAVASASAAF